MSQTQGTATVSIKHGILGHDPEIGYTSTDRSTLTIRVLTRHKGRDQWHECVVKDERAEWAARHLRKGDIVSIDGWLNYRHWTDAHGNPRVQTEIIISWISGASPLPDRGGA